MPDTAPLHPLRVEIIGGELALVWSDGAESYLSLEKLRRHCPCAACGGEPDVMGNIQRPHVSYGPGSFELRSFRFIGGYLRCSCPPERDQRFAKLRTWLGRNSRHHHRYGLEGRHQSGFRVGII